MTTTTRPADRRADEREGPPPAVRDLRPVLAPIAAVLVAVVALLVALTIGGGAAPVAGGDPGALVRYGRPVAQLLVNLAAAATLGSLVLATSALAPGDRRWDRLLDAAAISAGVWAVAAGAVGFLTFLGSTSLRPADARFGPALLLFASAIPVGQSWLASAVAAALLTVLVIAVRSHTGVALLVVAAVGALVPMALQGHAAADSPGDHGTAIVAFGLHIVFAAIWLGGLGALLVAGGRSRGAALADLASRYSSIALVCFVVVGLSGIVSAIVRIGDPRQLLTAYGSLVLVKSAALVLAGAIGAAHRAVVIPRIAEGTGRAPFLRLVVGELLVLGVASGFAAALAFSSPPDRVLAPLTSPAQLLTGSPLPPPMTFSSVLGAWRIDPLWLLICGFLACAYLAGVTRLRRRGDRWPIHRTICWLAGVAVLLWLTCGGLAVYQEVLFSAHMLEHMALTMLVPLLLVPAAPITLALRAIRRRRDGTRGGREWLLIAVHSRVSRVLTNPIVAAVLFAGSLVVFYYSPLFRWATTDHIGHEWMTAHFLGTGYLFVQSLIGVDPTPVRLAYPLRLLVLLATMAFHAFFGLTLLLGTGLLLADWYGAMGWGTSALADQRAGGGIAWSVGEIPTLLLAVVVAMTWARSDDRDARRRDRAAERDGDAELNAYNEMLGRLGRSGA